MSVVSRLEDADSRSFAGSRNADDEDDEDEDMADQDFQEDDSADEDYQEDDGGDDMSLATSRNNKARRALRDTPEGLELKYVTDPGERQRIIETAVGSNSDHLAKFEALLKALEEWQEEEFEGTLKTFFEGVTEQVRPMRAIATDERGKRC